ncbi:MAG TPA: hypothetical protein PLO89_06615, partial [Spirochaetota bacterium]|nr:hypothetical protein [Spirochaetota bacterium]
VFFISPYSKFNRDLNVSIIELRGLTFGFTCFLIDYYKNCKENKAGFFYANANLKLENFTIDFEFYNSILHKYNLENDLELGNLLALFSKSINNCKYVRAELSKNQTKTINVKEFGKGGQSA